MSSDRENGFTLLEVLVALVVVGMVISGLTQGVAFGLAAWDRQARVVEAHAERDAAVRIVRNVIERLDPAALVRGRAHGIVFTSVLPPGPSWPVGEADMLLHVDAGRLVLSWTPHLHAERVNEPVARDLVLLEGVERLDLSYFPRGDQAVWASVWEEAAPPALVRLRVTFSGADLRHWPDVLVVPMRDRAE